MGSRRATAAPKDGAPSPLAAGGAGAGVFVKLPLAVTLATLVAAFALGWLRRPLSARPHPPMAMAMMGDDDDNDLFNLLGLAESADLPGAIPPLNYWDPLGFSQNQSYNQLKVWRESELKHGRLAMLAALGILVGERFHPLFGGQLDGSALATFTRPELTWFWVLLVPVVFLLEWPTVKAFEPFEKAPWTLRETHVPGAYGFDPLGLKPGSKEAYDAMQCKELSNGRLAMLAVMGMLAQEWVSGAKLL